MLSQSDPRPIRSAGACGSRPIPLLVALLGVALGAAVLPTPRTALAAPASATADVGIVAGPGGEYDWLASAPTGAPLSVDGEAVNGYVPVTYNGVSGWAPAWAVTTDAAPAVDPAAGAPDQAASATVDGAPVDPAAVDPAAVAPAPVDVAPADPAAAAAGSGAPPADAAAAPAAASEEPARGGGGSGGDVTQIIRDAALKYGQSPEAMLRVARCESGLNPQAVGGGIYYGLFQFVPSTFEGTPYGQYDIMDPWANANAAAWMWSQGRKGEWSCR